MERWPQTALGHRPQLLYPSLPQIYQRFWLAPTQFGTPPLAVTPFIARKGVYEVSTIEQYLLQTGQIEDTAVEGEASIQAIDFFKQVGLTQLSTLKQTESQNQKQEVETATKVVLEVPEIDFEGQNQEEKPDVPEILKPIEEPIEASKQSHISKNKNSFQRNNRKVYLSPRSNAKKLNAKKTSSKLPDAASIRPKSQSKLISQKPRQESRTRRYRKRNEENEIYLTAPELDEMNLYCNKLYRNLMLPERDASRRLDLIDRLNDAVKIFFPDQNPKLTVFGSSANGLTMKNADLDLCLTLRRNFKQSYLIRQLGLALRRHKEFRVLCQLPLARVPIVKLRDRKTNISCDICFNNSLAIHNTKLIADYMSIDPRAKKLCFFIKHWAKRRNINEVYTGTLSSYAYTIMLIHYLQRRNPPILPCLQELVPPDHDPVIVSNFDCSYYSDLDNLDPWIGCNGETVAELLIGFFKFYAHEFDYNKLVVSIRSVQNVFKKDKNWPCVFAIEDPFEFTHNLAKGVQLKTFCFIVDEFRRAFDMCGSKNTFAKICSDEM